MATGLCPVTLGHIRGHGCPALVVYCVSPWCNHSATLTLDWLPDHTAVRSLNRRLVCTACGLIGADVRPDWSSHTGGAGMVVPILCPEGTSMCRFILTLVVLFLLGQTATAEQACVKFHQCIPLDEFKCHTITRSTAIRRVCYAEAKQYMVLWFKRRDGVDSTPYHFCALGLDVFKEFMAADSMGRFYNERIGGTRNKHGPFDCRDHPIPTF